jgi:DNA-binding LacI/PurR family transcriptional regulator
MAVSLKQIAAQTNVSIATVSKVLSGREDVSDKTRQRILKVAKDMNYRPNLLVRGIQTGKTNTIGVMVPVGSDAFFSNIVAGIHKHLQYENYVPILLWASRLPDDTWASRTELELIHQLVDRRVDGLIVRPIEDAASDDYLHEIHDHHLPLVAVDRALPNSHRADFVGTDDYCGGQLAAEHLLELGHRHILHLAGPDFASTARHRREGFESVIRQCPDVRYDVIMDKTFTGSNQQLMHDYFDNHPLPTAIFAANDFMAARLYNVLHQRQVRIGHDVSVIGFSDLDFAQYMQPSLTTLLQHPLEIGTKAAQLVLNRINNASEQVSEYEPVQIRLKPELIARESTMPPRRGQ